MAFSTKQLFGLVLLVALSLVALSLADHFIVATIVQRTLFATLILAAYGIWISQGEARAFRIGFLCWTAIYYLLEVVLDSSKLSLGTRYWPDKFVLLVHPDAVIRDGTGNVTQVVGSATIEGFRYIGACILAIVFGLIGGIVTVYFYRKRQRLLAANQPSN